MRRKTHKGQFIDMDSLISQNEKAVAVGNMGVNAKGDKVGSGGEVVQTSQNRTRKHYNTPTTTTTTSLKDDISEETIFPDEKVDEKSESKKRPAKKKVEKETPDGDIIIE